jgi:hypothetical protein
MQIGSPLSNRIGTRGRVIFQFMVNVEIAQSVSTIPSSGVAPSLHQFAGPRTYKLYPGGRPKQVWDFPCQDAMSKVAREKPFIHRSSCER